jgi:hypothetical protein
MNTIHIKSFGPIGEGYGGPMPIFPITIFCGLQGGDSEGKWPHPSLTNVTPASERT